NGSVRPAPAAGAKTCRAVLADISGSGPAQDGLDRGPRQRHRIAEFDQRLGGIAAMGQRRFQPGRSLSHRESADRPRRTFERMRQCPRLRRQGGERVEQFGGLSREHRQHFLLEAGVAERHALEMLEIDRTVIGCEWRRWHPTDPFEMKRHDLAQSRCCIDPAGELLLSQSRKWLMERMRYLPQIGLVLADAQPHSPSSRKNSEDY